MCYRMYFPRLLDESTRLSSDATGKGVDGSPCTLENRLSACQGFASALTAVVGHIWQLEPFQLRVNAQGEENLSYLEGRSCFGDNVEVLSTGRICLVSSLNVKFGVQDEWLVVYILFQLSKHYPEACLEVVCSVTVCRFGKICLNDRCFACLSSGTTMVSFC